MIEDEDIENFGKKLQLHDNLIALIIWLLFFASLFVFYNCVLKNFI